jgi:hypothetical protein
MTFTMHGMSCQFLLVVFFTYFQKYESKVYENVVVGNNKVISRSNSASISSLVILCDV